MKLILVFVKAASSCLIDICVGSLFLKIFLALLYEMLEVEFNFFIVDTYFCFKKGPLKSFLYLSVKIVSIMFIVLEIVLAGIKEDYFFSSFMFCPLFFCCF
jgi:hypothetical protein